MSWNNTVIAVVAGDAREQEIARCAVRAGATVRAYGFPWPEEGIEGVYHAKDAADALKGADIALFPIPGITAEGALFAPKCPEKIIPTREMLEGMRKPGHIILGWGDANLKGHCAELGITLHEYEWDVDLMLLRGPAIVEGVLKVIIENTEITIHKSNICLVGQGTIGSLLTNTLVALGAHVHVAARNPVQRAAAYAAGAESLTLEQLPEYLPKMDIVIGSVPKRLLDRDQLKLLPKHALLVDVAAPPGTIDREAAAELGMKAIWARGMGARAPITVGRSQWSGISRRIEGILEQK
ncbi:dipicolinate synthase subunit A [Aminobacter aminovorans]|uniref:Stage V sporulation protein FA n=1 Tax=Aminobacter aminovorans TaxID=83263 RepID=A0A381IMY9_AMIAI|nr:dipicolinate synthase subunit DpsA [Aminobacter aminovorans]TCS24465.1 dipicolinate synthase subunit A [Aminobacter aminovorans]SUY29331.1 Stage V sporulation protein FA [Aminobacter aminovorans]